MFVPSANAAEGGYGNYVPGTYGDFVLAGAPEAKLTLRNDVYYYNADIARVVVVNIISKCKLGLRHPVAEQDSGWHRQQ